ncbi:MAG: hypothetical protein Q9168_007668, partial [Polycauliona sp. 1 TL-2023]
NLDIIQLDIEELINGFEGPFDGDVILQLDGDFVVDEGFEETVCTCQNLKRAVDSTWYAGI